MADIRYELFLRDHLVEIDADNFAAVYNDASAYFDKAKEIGQLTDLFLSCGIEPHMHFEYAIPTDYAFNSSNLITIDIKDSIERIGHSAFDSSELESISFGYNSRLTYISMCAFRGCNNLRSIHLPNSLETIASQAFEDCRNLEHVYFGKNIIGMIGENIFKNCRNVTLHVYEGTKPHRYAIQHNIKFELNT